MSRYEVRYALHHPLRWLSIWWLHLGVAFMLVGVAVAWTADVYSTVLRPNLWPIAMGCVAMAVLVSALAPFARGLQAITGASLITLGILRAVALIEVLARSDVPLGLVTGLAFHALLMAALGVVWPDWTRACGTRATVEAGREETGG